MSDGLHCPYCGRATCICRERELIAANKQAAKHEPQPVGNGPIVLERVLGIIDHSFSGVSKPSDLALLRADLQQRAEYGKNKYGTYLRAFNGRKALVDLYQEITDAIMYAEQARMEGDDEAGAYVETLIAIGARLAGLLKQRS